MKTSERALSVKQVAWVTKMEVSKLLVVGSDGLLRIYLYDDGDVDLSVGNDYDAERLALCVVPTTRVENREGKAFLRVTISLDEDFRPDPYVYFVIGHFSMADMVFSDPIYLVSSMELVRRCQRSVGRGAMRLSFTASLSAGDPTWGTDAETHGHLGKRVLELLRTLKPPAGRGRHTGGRQWH